MEEEKTTVGILLVPFRPVSHLVPMVEFARNLLQHPFPNYRFNISALQIHNDPPSQATASYISAVSAATPEITFFDLMPASEMPEVPASLGMPDIFFESINILKPVIKSAIQDYISSSPFPIGAIILDLFCTALIDVAHELNIPSYVFYIAGASLAGLMLHLPTVDAALPPGKELKELEEDGVMMHVPGFSKPLSPLDLPAPVFSSRKKLTESNFAHYHSRHREAKGIIINTFVELEPAILKALDDGLCIPDHPTPPIYPVGPMIYLNPKTPETEQHECIQWLNNQPPASVIYLCFGNMGSFKPNQAKEIAMGLERSGHRFLWVLRSPPPPPEKQQKNPPARLPVDAKLEEVLPEGFLERTSGKGLVWPKFAPQADILGHEAVGGFVTHCGWNSCLESLWYGVPMVGWPQAAEQHILGAAMEGEMGVSALLRTDRRSGNWATAEEVERGVRRLMDEESEEGRRIRAKALRMKEEGKRALEDGGSSYQTFTRWAEEVTRGIEKKKN